MALLLASLQGCRQLEGETVSEHLKMLVAKGNLTKEERQQLIQVLCLWKLGGVRNNGNSHQLSAKTITPQEPRYYNTLSLLTVSPIFADVVVEG